MLVFLYFTHFEKRSPARMKTPVQTPRKQRNPRNSSTPPVKRTSNLLHNESKEIVSPSPMMISPVPEETKVRSPDVESSMESVEILDSYFIFTPTADENLVFDTDSSLSALSEITSCTVTPAQAKSSPLSASSEIASYTVNSSQAKSDESEISNATEISKNLEFPDDSTLAASFEVINSNISPNESAESEAISSHSKKKTENKDAEEMMMVDLLKRSGIDLTRRKSLLKIGGTNLNDDLSEFMCVKARVGIFYFVIWIGVALIILLSKSSSSGVSISLTPPPT
ncbi:uncharacterized protein LOC113304869 isoform X2 [Papaver somniferum]|uniref:uncharacterized protein LOC113304869 isoform X2 n=1 Tax=Papaver somniferum TaxID=3469 RepID=UPI000E7045CE|nr:uncharacterized protein LOC113304869 isoform X2 [Papaver somniferum]